MEGFKTSTPADIADYSVDDVLGILTDREGSCLPSKRVRLNYVKMIYDVLGFDLTADIALAAASDVQSMLVLAIAGGGKTTWAQVMATMQKLIRPSKSRKGGKVHGDNILCLVYNRHNVADMKDKHKQMVHRLMSAGIRGLDIDDNINACTMHSFCDFWRKQYVAQMNLFGSTLLTDEESVRYMQRAINVAEKAKKGIKAVDLDASKVLGLYQYYKESMCGIEDLENNDKFSDLNLSLNVVEYLFERYETIKARSRKYDFTDMLWRFYTLLNTNEDVRNEVQRYYEYVIADEVQDFTPLMWSILKLLVSNGTPLTCIGDEDQNIYRFRGADIYSLLNFSSEFEGGTVFSLIKNRRCGKEILDYSRRVVSRNTLRFNKLITGSKTGGDVRFCAYSSDEGQLISVVKELEKKNPDELQNTVVCYRDSVCSALLVDLLEEKGIPFHVIRGRQPLSHELYRHVMDVLNVLCMPCDRMALLNLYKVLPCSRDKIYEVLGYSPERRKFAKEDAKLHFAQYYYGDLIKINGFVDAMETLIRLSAAIERTPLSEIFPEVYSLLDKYYWKYKKSNNPDAGLDEMFEDRVKRFFSQDKKYLDVVAELDRRRSVCSKNTSSGAGVALATFHSLKGLEFDTVYTIFMDNDIFPNYPLIENRGYPADVEQELKESETRLWYVAVTRAKKNLIVYYSKDNPSKYVMDELHLGSGAAAIKVDSSIYERMSAAEQDKTEDTQDKAEDVMDLFIDDTYSFAEGGPYPAGETGSIETSALLEEPPAVTAVSRNAYMERLLCSL